MSRARERGLGRGLGCADPDRARARSERAAPPRPVAGRRPAPDGRRRRPRVAAGRPAADAADARRPSRRRRSAAAPVAGAYFAELPLDSITPNPRQPREVFDEEAMAELVHSIREVGLLQPVVVRPVGPDRYELIMGERRWRAAQEPPASSTIPAIVRATDDDVMLRDALLENLHRAQLNPLEEAAAYDQLLTDFGCTHDELAGRIGRSRPQISNTLRLLQLPPSVQRRVAAGVLSAGHARALLGLDDADGPGAAGPADRGRGAVGAHASRRSSRVGGEPARRPSRRAGKRPVAPKLERSWPTGCRTGSRPG